MHYFLCLLFFSKDSPKDERYLVIYALRRYIVMILSRMSKEACFDRRSSSGVNGCLAHHLAVATVDVTACGDR